MAKNDKKYTARELTTQLKMVAMECDTTDVGGDLITNAEVLARMIWKKALGYTEEVEAADGRPYNKTYTSASWAIQLILERLEGKVASVAEADSDRITVADKVGELAVNLVNSVTADAMAGGNGPPPLPPKVGG